MAQKSSTPLILGVVLALIFVGGSIFVIGLPNNPQPNSSSLSSVISSSSSQTTFSSQSIAALYADGIYSAAGNYKSPSALETVEVGLTLQGNVITQVTTSTESKSETSAFWMQQFRDGVVDVVVGKSIDDIKNDDVAVVNGASLTGEGFIKALDGIKQQAKK